MIHFLEVVLIFKKKKKSNVFASKKLRRMNLFPAIGKENTVPLNLAVLLFEAPHEV